MDAAQVQQRTQQLSADDGDIRQALEVLEDNLGAWFEAYSTLAEPEPAVEQPIEPATPKGLLIRDEALEAETESESELQTEAEAEQPAIPAAPVEDIEQESTVEDTEADRRREEDESLLSTLDPEVATAIRIKRRLGDRTRSVRELLDEYEQEQEASKKESQRKRWWR